MIFYKKNSDKEFGQGVTNKKCEDVKEKVQKNQKVLIRKKSLKFSFSDFSNIFQYCVEWKKIFGI
jgi:hypothetical protein